MKQNKRILSLAEITISDQELEQQEFQVLRVGEFYDKRYGKFSVTGEMLDRLKENFDKKVLEIDVALDVNHEAENGAFAWLRDLDVRNGGLFARFKDFTEDAKRIFKEKIYKYFSVEFAPFETVKDGKKITIKDVLRGIALTNRPVIKGMQPTFLAEDVKNSFKKNDMNIVKLFAEDVLTREKVTDEDVKSLKRMFATLSEEEQTEAKEAVDKVEAEAEKQEAEAEKQEAEEEGKKEEKKEEGGKEASAELSEMRVKLSEQNKELKAIRASEEKRKFTERVEGLTLSETNLTGFTSGPSKELSEFVSTISDDQFAAFSELVKCVKTVDKSVLSELGHGKGVEVKDEAAKFAEVNKRAKELAEKGVAMHEAVRQAQKELL